VWAQWRFAVMALALAMLGVGFATVAGSVGSALFDVQSGAMEPGARAPGDIEALSAARMGAYFLAFQTSMVLATLFSAWGLRRAGLGVVLPMGWPPGGLPSIVLAVAGLLALATAAGLAIYVIDKQALAADLRPFAELARSRNWWVLLLAAGIGAPIAEELLFRGMLFSGLRRSPLGFSGAALVSTLFWTSLHATYSPYGLALLVLIGLYFCWLRETSGSLWPPIAAHAVYNSAIVLALAFSGSALERLA
jgi:membrane protease YdiL (CAAX protease family)